MRRRLLLLVFTTTLVAVTLVGVILLTAIWAATDTAALERAAANARVDSAALSRILEAGGTVDQAVVAELVRDQATLEVQLPDGTTITSGTAIQDDSYVAAATDGGVTVTVSIPRSVYVERTIQEGLLVVAIAAVALAIAMLVAYVYARRLTRPLEDFAVAAERIATGDTRPVSQRYGVPELDAVADVLDRSASSVNELLESERRATAAAAHQLRTPLTGLSLRLEEILATHDLEQVRVEATAALGQVERLAGVVDEVVALHRGQVTDAEPVPVDDLVAGQVTEWSPAFESAGRLLRRTGVEGLVVSAVPGAQAQALATLLENSLVHGRGTTTVRTRPSGAWSVVEVFDEGPGVPDDLAQRVFERSVSGSRSTGLGLSLARTLVAADGGRLELVSARPAVFAMFLPAHPAVERGAQAQAEVAMAASSAASGSSGNTQRR